MASEPTSENITPEQSLRNELDERGGFVGKSVEELEEESRTDYLTNLLNRRGFEEQLNQAYAQAKRTGDRLQIVFIDGDKFKEVNDKYTRIGGDKVLVSIGDAMRETFRKYDQLARWGGDEFVVIALEEPFKAKIDEEDIQSRLNAKLKELRPANFDAEDLSVTVGLVEWDGVSGLQDLQQKVQEHMDERK